jgi:hypothetical protein
MDAHDVNPLFALSGGTTVKKLLVLAALALAVPSLALAAKPPAPGNSQGTHGKSAPNVLYILKGTLSAYMAASGSTNGHVTITITHANHHAKTLVNKQTPVMVTIAVSSTTKVHMHAGATTITDGDKGVVKVRLPKNTPAADLLTTLENAFTVARQVIDQGPAS